MARKYQSPDQKRYAYLVIQAKTRPNWRAVVAEQMAQAGIPASAAADPIIRRLVAFQVAEADSADSAAAADPELTKIAEIHGNTRVSSTLKILVIADTPPADISAAAGVDAPTLALWEACHFDVRGRLCHSSWVAHFVIDAEVINGNRHLAEQLRLAMRGGPETAKLVLRAENSVALDVDEELLLLQTKLQFKLEQALRFPLDTPSQALDLVKATVALERVSAGFALAKAKLEQQERDAQRQHELEMLRLQIELAKASSPAAAASSSQPTHATSPVSGSVADALKIVRPDVPISAPIRTPTSSPARPAGARPAFRPHFLATRAKSA